MVAYTSAMNDERPHHQHLEQARVQIVKLLSRQAVERELVSRAETGSRQDVVAALIARQQQAALEQRLAQFHPADIAFVLESLPPESRKHAWELVRAERRGAVLLETTAAVRGALMSDVAPDEIAAVVRAMHSEDIADLIAGLPQELGREVLARLDREGQEEVSSVLSFPADTVGALMTRDAVTVRDDASLEAVLRLLRRRQKLPPHTTQLFVVDRDNVLKGLLPVSRLLLGQPESLVSEGMTVEPVFFHTDDPAREVVASFERYGLISAPVVNLHREVVGRVTVDSVMDEIKQRTQSESLRQVGLTEEEDLYAPVRKSARNRWPWLGVNLLTAFAASRVIGAFEEVIVQLVALAALMPIVASIGGNSGNQSVALVIRGMALNQLGPQQLRQMLLKELRVASINGALWGAVMAVATLILYQNWALALVIALALLLNLLTAAAVGVSAPVILHRFGRDPVMGSSIVLTATTDCLGFFYFLGLAALFLV